MESFPLTRTLNSPRHRPSIVRLRFSDFSPRNGSFSPRRVSEKHEIVKKVHFVFLRNTHLFETCVMLAP